MTFWVLLSEMEQEPNLVILAEVADHCELLPALEEPVLAAGTEVDMAHNLSARGQSLVAELKPRIAVGYSLGLSLLLFHAVRTALAGKWSPCSFSNLTSSSLPNEIVELFSEHAWTWHCL